MTVDRGKEGWRERKERGGQGGIRKHGDKGGRGGEETEVEKVLAERGEKRKRGC